MSNPKRYDIEQVVKHVDEDAWMMPAGNPSPGDRLIVWKAKGNTQYRGVVALAEVLSKPKIMPSNPKTRQFWHDKPSKERMRRIHIRYVIPAGAPLWETSDNADVFAGLTVAKAEGNQLYRVTEEQWSRILKKMGGWPELSHLQKAISIAAQSAMEETASTRGKGQGKKISPERRKAIEDHAMKIARDLFTSENYDVTDTSKIKPYDLIAKKHLEELYIEVKGTSTDGKKIILTRNEVDHALKHADKMVLFVLHNIEVKKRKGKVSAYGGIQRVDRPWNIVKSCLSPLSYTYDLDDLDK